MDKETLIKNIIGSTKNKNAEGAKKSIEAFLYNTAAEKIKNLKVETAKTFFKKQ
jgi:hypothetical protein